MHQVWYIFAIYLQPYVHSTQFIQHMIKFLTKNEPVNTLEKVKYVVHFSYMILYSIGLLSL